MKTEHDTFKYAKMWLLDSVWILGYELHGDKVHVVLHDRDPPADHALWSRVNSLPDFQLVETDVPERRTVVRAVIASTSYEVDNPAHVFSYPRFQRAPQ